MNAQDYKERLYFLLPWFALTFYIFCQQMHCFGRFCMASDDAYIYLSYVKNTITSSHDFFSYNPGEHSNGITGLLYYYLLILTSSVVRVLTSHLSVQESLTLAAYLTNSILYLLTGLVFLSIIKCLFNWTTLSMGKALIGFALFHSNYKFLWSLFGGLENPLTVYLLLSIFYYMLKRPIPWKTAVAASAVTLTRPELSGIMFILPALSVFLNRQYSKRTAVPAQGKLLTQLLQCYCIFIFVCICGLLPCYWTTGRILPASMAARAHLELIFSFRYFTDNLLHSFEKPEQWFSEWPVWNYILLGCSLLTLLNKNLQKTGLLFLTTGLIILLHFFIRAVSGLWDFSVHYRYISFFWPFYTLGLFVFLWSLREEYLKKIPIRPIIAKTTSRFFLFLLLIIAGKQVYRFQDEFKLDVLEMNEMSVTPALWMQKHLPKNSRIVMEPAGAIRFFTDLYLIDAVGLTTRHRESYQGSTYYEFIKENNADYVFDYENRMPELTDRKKFTPQMVWEPQCFRFSLGIIGLYKVK
jgi:hypothetical protein